VQSIIDSARNPTQIEFIPVTGPRRDGSNDFIYARFLVPHLCGFSGRALFLDGDMIVRRPVEELFELAPLDVGVSVVKRPDYETKHPVKYLGNANANYPRKNWSSVILWNCGFMPNRLLTPEFVGSATGSYLHRFEWLSDRQIGALPSEWNRLVLEEPTSDDDALWHYTIGTPCFAEYADCERSREWYETYKRASAPLGD
jgi:lipopolysaccharide biosynthesis glycosyltransferase